MTSQFDLTRFYDVIIRNSGFQLGFLTREFEIPNLNCELILKTVFQCKFKFIFNFF